MTPSSTANSSVFVPLANVRTRVSFRIRCRLVRLVRQDGNHVAISRHKPRSASDELHAITHQLMPRNVRLRLLDLVHTLQNIFHPNALTRSCLAVIERPMTVSRQMQRGLSKGL